jgi:hypothetical protein
MIMYHSIKYREWRWVSWSSHCIPGEEPPVLAQGTRLGLYPVANKKISVPTGIDPHLEPVTSVAELVVSYSALV